MPKSPYLVHVVWMTNHGPMDREITYRGVHKHELKEEGGRLLLHFEKFTLWLFTRHMASCQIDEAA